MLRTPVPPFDAARVRIGCDVHAVSEVADSIARFGDRYLQRVFTADERAQCAGPRAVERLAARFAAKEAVVKVLRVPRDVAVPWSTIEVRSGADGAPRIRLTGTVAALADAQRIDRIDVSLSHDAGVAMAVAAAVPAPMSAPVPATPGGAQ